MLSLLNQIVPIKEFFPGHAHSHGSLMDSFCTPEEIIVAAKSKNLKSIALTDHGTMHMCAQFYKASKKHGVKPAFGMEAYSIGSLATWREAKEQSDALKKIKKKTKSEEEVETTDEEIFSTKAQNKALRKKGHLVLLAKNLTGLSDLYELCYLAHRDGFYAKPRIDKDMLGSRSGNLVASTACMGGIVSNKCWEFKNGEIEWWEVVKEAQEYEEVLGKGNFFLELQFNQEESQKYINDCMMKISQQTGIPLTVTTDSHYIKESDWEVQDVLYMLRSKPVKTFATRGDDWHGPVPGLYIKSAEEMWNSYLKYSGTIDQQTAIQAFNNTLLIDSMIESFEPDTRMRLPTLPYDNTFKELVTRSFNEMKIRGFDKKEDYVRRLKHELTIIKEKGFSNYFIIMQDIIRQAKMTQRVGSGRGSSAGSLLCYVLGITDLDPIEHGLFFERFLNPARMDAPDVDSDFSKPDEVKEMLIEKYGKDNMACLSTFSTFNPKSLTKDLGRVYDMDLQIISGITEKIEAELQSLKGPEGMPPEITYEMATFASPSLKKFLDENQNIESVYKVLYGKNRHLGRHAAGIVIGDNLPRETALVTSKGVVQTSFTEGLANKDLSSMGLVKFDILGIDTLSVIDMAANLIAKKLGKTYEEISESLRPHNLDLTDQNVYKNVFHEGRFTGIFQCVDELTKIQTLDGLKNISSIKNGEEIYSYDENKNVITTQKVLNVINNGKRDCIELYFGPGYPKLICTPDHLIFTKNRGWIQADQLTSSDELLKINKRDFFQVNCKNCNVQFNTKKPTENRKKRKLFCQSCSIKCEWAEEKYYISHIEPMRMAFNDPAIKLLKSKLKKKQWKERPEIFVKFTNSKFNPEVRKKAGLALSKKWLEDDAFVKKMTKLNKKGFKQFKVVDSYGKNRTLRSSYEMRFVNILKKNNIKWQYEKRFKLSSGRTFIIDFFLPELNFYFEVKGFWMDDAEEKWKLFLSDFPNLKAKLIFLNDINLLESGVAIEAYF